MDKLNILWTTSNRDTITNMMKMYSIGAIKRGWWKEINIIIWGASAKLLGENVDVQKEVLEMIEHGINFEACQHCADQYGATEKIKSLGIDTKYMGEPLTGYLKNDEKVLTL